jgi:hypothetical protein
MWYVVKMVISLFEGASGAYIAYRPTNQPTRELTLAQVDVPRSV